MKLKITEEQSMSNPLPGTPGYNKWKSRTFVFVIIFTFVYAALVAFSYFQTIFMVQYLVSKGIDIKDVRIDDFITRIPLETLTVGLLSVYSLYIGGNKAQGALAARTNGIQTSTSGVQQLNENNSNQGAGYGQ
jgi:hypothetical protein